MEGSAGVVPGGMAPAFKEAYQAWLSSSCPVAGLPTLEALSVLLVYILSLAVVGCILPGRRVQGAALSDKTRITYKCNGFWLLLLLVATLSYAAHAGLIPATYIADHGGDLFVTANLLVFALSFLLLFGGRASSSKAASFKPHAHGSLLLDWWLGVQLNPRLLGIDIKFFWLRPSMMAWLLINLSVAAKQVEQQGTLSLPMALYQIFTAVYISDYFWFEEYMTSTWDIIAENFGYMLLFGDFVWVPWVFSAQAWWLLKHSPHLPPLQAGLLVALFLTGYTVFRGANRQKHIYKQDPKRLIWGRPPRVIGGKLLASGYWGLARKSNYLGDILLALSYSLPCGFSSIIPYVYPIYLITLLLHREYRDGQRCRAKYKDVWEEYCKVVPYRIFPGVY